MRLHKGKKRSSAGMWLLGLLCCSLLSACSEKEPAAEAELAVKTVEINPLTQEQTSTVVYGDVSRRVLYEGIITPYVEELSFPEEGNFLQYKVKLGESVEKGEILAETDVTSIKKQLEDYQKQIRELTDTYEYNMQTKENSRQIAELELQIIRERLEAEDYLSGEYTQLCIQAGQWDKQIRRLELEMRQLTESYDLELPYLQEKLAEKQEKLTANRIVAPFDGVVTSLQPMTCGDHVSDKQPYIAVSDITRYQVVGDYVSQKDMQDALGVTAFINGREYPLSYIPMEEEAYYSILKKNEIPYSTYELTPSEELSHGMSALIVLQQSKAENVLLVPGIAVHQEGSRKYCYRRNGEKKEKVYIQVGLYDTINYEVTGGLEEGDEVYLDW